MKIAICKIGANITFSNGNSSAANADILYFLRQLDPSKHLVTIVSHKTRNTVIPSVLDFKEVLGIGDFDKFDLVVLFNGSINFFGGAEDKNLIALYRAMSKSETPIAYINTDGQLMFKQLWGMIENRSWARGYTSEEFYIDPNKVTYLTQGRNVSAVQAKILSKPLHVKTSNVSYYPFDTTILSKSKKHFKPPVPLDQREFGLVFGGATRNTYKRKRIEHYYNQDDALLFGNLRGVNCPKAKFEGKVSYRDFGRMMQRGVNTVIVGDEFYEDNFTTLRVWESMLAGNLTYIDERFDSEHTIYNNPNFSHMYINRPSEIWGHRNEIAKYASELINTFPDDTARSRLTEELLGCI